MVAENLSKESLGESSRDTENVGQSSLNCEERSTQNHVLKGANPEQTQHLGLSRAYAKSQRR